MGGVVKRQGGGGSDAAARLMSRAGHRVGRRTTCGGVEHESEHRPWILGLTVRAAENDEQGWTGGRVKVRVRMGELAGSSLSDMVGVGGVGAEPPHDRSGSRRTSFPSETPVEVCLRLTPRSGAFD